MWLLAILELLKAGGFSTFLLNISITICLITSSNIILLAERTMPSLALETIRVYIRIQPVSSSSFS